MKVELTERAAEDLEDLQPTQHALVQQVFVRLAAWPEVTGAKPMRRELKGHFRIRTGDWRVIFKVTASAVVVTRIANRSEVYEE
jgi:mRNA-degrading endonuclease RelE of RelBE toxin-antitoxin system